MMRMEINIFTVLDDLGIDYSEAAGRDDFYIYCPKCSSSSNSNRKTLNINLPKENFRCPRCNVSGGFVDFYGMMKHGIEPRSGYTFRDLIKDLKGQGDKRPKTGITMEKYLRQHKARLVEVLSVEERDRAYRSFLNKLTLEFNDREDLIRRGLNDDFINYYGYKSLPMTPDAVANAVSAEGIKLKGVPGFYLKNKNQWTVGLFRSGGTYIPYRDLDGRIQGMQIKTNNVDGSDLPKYMWFTSSSKEGGSGASAYPHFQRKYKVKEGENPYRNVILTEGGLKGDIINYFLNVSVVAIPGVNTLSTLTDMLDDLKARGCVRIYTAFDIDYLSNKFVSEAYIKLIKLLLSKGFSVTKLHWDVVSEGTGFDDYLLHLRNNNLKKLKEIQDFFD